MTTMAKQDYYETLGIDREADGAAIKKAYRKLAMQYHPDRNQGDKQAEQKFKEISEAYEVLKDDQKRAAYDRFGHSAFEQGHGAGAGAGAGFGSFADIFEEMFSDLGGGFPGGAGGRGGSSTQRGSDLRYNLEISLEEAFNGKQTKIRVPSWDSCESCDGTGAEAGTKPEVCGTCNGRGRVRAQQGFFTIERTCHTCGGTGQIIADPCRVCGGSGRVRKEKTLSVNIPAGVEDGTRIRLSGEGEAGMRGGPSGDLYVFLTLKEHTIFERHGADLYCQVPVAMTTAALGGQIEVPNIEGGRNRVSVPAGTQSGHKMRLKGKGMSVLRSSMRGDMYIDVQVETPVHLNDKQKDLLKQFDDLSSKKRAKHSPKSESFFTKVKEFFEDLKD